MMDQATVRIEAKRLATLRAFGVLDTPAEPAFDRLTDLASDIFKTPIALVSLVDADRQWFKSKLGLEACSTDRDKAFCAHAIEMGPNAVMVVEDATRDARFANNPLVTGAPDIRFYAGATLTTRDGYNLGTLCVIDTKPRRKPTVAKLNRLKMLAQIAVDALELGRVNRLIQEKQRLLDLAEQMSGVGHWRLDLATNIPEWSDGVYAIHGVSRDEFDPSLHDALSFYPPEDQAKVAQHIADAIATKGGFEFQVRLNRADGAVRDVVSHAVCELDHRGEVVALFGLFRDVTDQERILRVIQSSEQRHRLLTENVGDVITRCDFKGAGSYISPAVEQLLGFTPLEAVGHDAPFFLHPDDLVPTMAAFEAMSRGCVEKTIQHRSRHKDGHYVWVESHLRLVTDDQGLPQEIVAVSRDISDRKALEQDMVAAGDLARTQAQRALLAETIAGVGYWRIDLLNGGLTLSPKMYEIYGLDPAEPPTMGRMMRMIHPDDQAWVTARIEQRLLTGEADYNVVNRIVRLDGQTRYLSGSSIIERNADGQMITLVGTVMDITERREAEMALVESEARYRLLAENATDMISEFALDGTISFVTPASRAALGYEPEELVGRTILEFVHPDDQPGLVARYLDFVTGPQVADSPTFQYRVRRKDGAWIWLEGRPRVIRDPETGAAVSMQDVVRDITARKSAEAELRQARAEAEAAAAVKSEFLANMSHELRTPLTAVLGFTRLIEIQPELSETTRQYTHRASNAGKALLATVNDILDFSKLEAGQVEIKPVATAPAQVAIDALDLFSLQAAEKGLRLEVSGLEALPARVVLDPERLRQVLLNFLGNAVKFTEEGVVTLSAAYDLAAQQLTLSVADSGPGVPAERQARLFQRFSQVDASSTRKHGGTGLGLAICRGLVEAMGGEIGVVSEAGQGARFWFTIPAPVSAPDDLEAGLPASSAPVPLLPRGCRVLLADDNASNRELVRAVLQVFDVDLHAVADGHAALQAASAAPYDIILMDLRMPGLDGASAARRIRLEDGPNVSAPILAFSAEAGLHPEDGLFDGAVSKPLTALGLISAMAGAIAGEPAHDAA
jgi:PAS domain S-box-containing protein